MELKNKVISYRVTKLGHKRLLGIEFLGDKYLVNLTCADVTCRACNAFYLMPFREKRFGNSDFRFVCFDFLFFIAQLKINNKKDSDNGPQNKTC